LEPVSSIHCGYVAESNQLIRAPADYSEVQSTLTFATRSVTVDHLTAELGQLIRGVGADVNLDEPNLAAFVALLPLLVLLQGAERRSAGPKGMLANEGSVTVSAMQWYSSSVRDVEQAVLVPFLPGAAYSCSTSTPDQEPPGGTINVVV
jgi:hypothetical protein